MSNSKHGPKNLPMDEIIDRYVNGMEFITTLAKDYEVTYTTMKNRLVKSGVKIRDKKEEKKRAMNREETKERVSEGSKRSADKRKQTNLEKYGHETAMCAPEIKEKWQKEHEEKYGVKYGTQRKDTIEKRKQTLLEQYGVDNVSKIPGVAQKISENRWQNKSEEELVEIISKMQDLSPESKERHREGIKKNRWENKSEEELKEIWDKTLNTWLENYGYDNPNKRPEMKEYLRKLKVESFLKYRLDNILDYLDLELLDEKDSWYNANTRYNFKCKKCNTIFNQYYAEIAYGKLSCPGCTTKINSSKGELQVRHFIKDELGIENISVDERTIISPFELDLYLHDYNIAIEYDGLYWHREDNLNFDKNYHLNKTKLCMEQGIRLIHIFEDEWAFKRDIVKERLKRILNLSNSERIHARNCTIMKIGKKEKDDFLEKYHLQGIGMEPRINLGAYYNNELVAVMTFSVGNPIKGVIQKEGEFELNRFCTNYNYQIPGIASKMLNYFKQNYYWKKIYTYADRRWSNGNLYSELGFQHIHNTNPTESYIYGMKRIHKFTLRSILNEDQLPIDNDGNPEWKIRLNQGYFRVWDCGHMKFELNNDLT